MSKKVETGALLLRLVVGLVFFIHGLDKYQSGLGNIAGWFESIGLPGFMAYIVGTIELFGGILLILGVGTRFIAWLLTCILVGAIVKVKLAVGFMGNGQMAGYEYDLVLLAVTVFLGLVGGGQITLAKLFGKGQNDTVVVK
ncbi:DoxX family protein [Brevibacillus ginsengisoli]|uniref:DoxX family protein n=1 Tax=Brevibacillus ginsengisoli TaxID=363854 RepID=UPI003CF72515